MFLNRFRTRLGPGANRQVFQRSILRRACDAGYLIGLGPILFLMGCAVASSFSPLPNITVQPTGATVAVGNTATFSVSATSASGLSYQWQKDTVNIPGATSASYTTPAAVAADNGTKFDVVVGNSAGNTTSNFATLIVNAAATSSPVDVVTHHYDVARTGVNSNETALSPGSVNMTTFGKVGEYTVDGEIDGQALYLAQLTIPIRGVKNVLYFATENDSVYALDADSITGTTATVLWQKSLVLANETAVPSGDLPCGNIGPTAGVLATPVIDRGRNAIYVVAESEDASKNKYWRLHALDLATGNELFGGPTTVTATYPGTGGNINGGIVMFDPTVQHERAALLESGNTIYTAWSGLWGDCGPYSSWVISYSADTLAQTGAIDLAPNNSGGGIWMGGGGPAADSSGDIYVISGNTFGDTAGAQAGAPGYYGNSFVRLSGSTTLSVVDYFTPFNSVAEDNKDLDFGSTAPLILPDLVDAGGTTRQLAVGSGKDGNMYVVQRGSMGEFNAIANNIYQKIAVGSSEILSPAIYFNNTVYVAPSGQTVQAFPITQALLANTPSSRTANAFGGAGAMPSISANGTTNGILWGLDYTAGVLYAYDATNLGTKLYDSNQNTSGRDHFKPVGGHFITPMVTNGKVYFGTGSSIVVFGLF